MGRRSLAVALVVGGSFVCNVARAEPVAPDVTADALVTTHLEGAVDARLEEHLDGDAWQTVCRAPCDVPLRVDATYRVNGPRIKASAPFVIAARERATIEVRPASSTRVVLGVAGTSAGAVLTLGALLSVAGASIRSGTAACGGDECTRSHRVDLTPEVIAAVGGGVLSALGIVETVLAVRAETRVSLILDGERRESVPVAPSVPEPAPTPVMARRAPVPSGEHAFQGPEGGRAARTFTVLSFRF